MEKDGTNHFLESCSAMADECPGLGLKCMQAQATCSDSGVAWHSKVKHHAVTDTEGHPAVAQGLEDTEKVGPELPAKAAEKIPADYTPKKYVLHTKYHAAVRALASYSHRVFVQGIIITLVVLSMTIALATNANDHVASHTWSVIDAVVANFFAFSWFVIVIHGLEYFHLSAVQKVVTHLVVSVLLLLASMLITWRSRSSEVSVDVFNGIFPLLVMWCNAGFVETTQKIWMDSVLYVLLTLILLVVWYALLGLLVHYGFAKVATTKGWGDETENLTTGGSLACGVVLYCHMAISGSFHSIEGPHIHPPSLMTVVYLNLLGLGFILVSMIVIPVLSRKNSSFANCTVGSNGYWKSRMCGIGMWFVKLLPCFSFALSLAHLVLGHTGYLHGSIGARLLFCCSCIVMAILMIALCSYVPFLKRDSAIAKQLSSSLLCLGGFMVGVAWSGLLDNSINMMAKGQGYGDPFLIKLAITGVLTVATFPVYCWYLKPVIMLLTTDPK